MTGQETKPTLGMSSQAGLEITFFVVSQVVFLFVKESINAKRKSLTMNPIEF